MAKAARQFKRAQIQKPDSDNGTQQLDTDAARQLLEQAQREKIEACSREVDSVLAKHGCIIDVSMILRAGAAPAPILRVLPKPQPQPPG